MTIADVTRELLVRYLDTWVPVALHAGKRVTCAYAWDGADGPSGGDTAEAALRVFAEFDDLLRTRRLAYVVVAPDVAATAQRLRAVAAELRTPANLEVHTLAGAPDAVLGTALSAVRSAGAPLFVCVQTETPWVPAATAGRPIDLMPVLPSGDWDARRAAVSGAGFPLVTGIELVDSAAGSALIGFATNRATSLEAFKNAVWSVDEYAGVRIRDPHDAGGQLLDISLDPHTGPLRRAMLAELASGPRTVTDLRHFALASTVYRAADATRVLTALLHAGAVTSDAQHRRLAGDVTVRLAGAT